MNKKTVTATLAGMLFWVAGCSTCGEPEGKILEDIDLPTKGEELSASKELPNTEPLAWEKLPLGVSKQVFIKDLAAMAGLPEDAPNIQCRDQITIDLVDPITGAIMERKSKQGALSNCALLHAGAKRSWNLVSARGEFLDDKLVAVTFRFPPQGQDDLVQELTGRFGEGRRQKLTELSIFEETTVETVLWKVEDGIWVIGIGPRGVRLIHQDAVGIIDATVAPLVAQKGTPVSLDAIGLGGGLDLTDPGIDAGMLPGGDR